MKKELFNCYQLAMLHLINICFQYTSKHFKAKQRVLPSFYSSGFSQGGVSLATVCTRLVSAAWGRHLGQAGGLIRGLLTPISHCLQLHHTVMHCTALHCTALHSTALHYTALHSTALHCPALFASDDQDS